MTSSVCTSFISFTSEPPRPGQRATSLFCRVFLFFRSGYVQRPTCERHIAALEPWHITYLLLLLSQLQSFDTVDRSFVFFHLPFILRSLTHTGCQKSGKSLSSPVASLGYPRALSRARLCASIALSFPTGLAGVRQIHFSGITALKKSNRRRGGRVGNVVVHAVRSAAVGRA
ncbi:hypothetical protein BC826DRAFT_1059837 [Russula brevipes]|nr:hypothetical protein BC826DRAFT_1059837 [Russula brevipes]